jgi:hypothetical protein
MSEIEAVVVSYKRPGNIPQILESLRTQTVPCSITLVNCAHGPEWEPDVPAGLCDRYLRFHENHGAYNRFLGAFFYEREFTYFHDDDMLPGTRVLEHFLASASNFEFGVLGQFGRMFPADGIHYRQNEIPRTESLTPVDLIVRAYFVRSRHLHHVLRLKWAMPPIDVKEDDMLLSCSLKMYAGLQSYLTPLSNDPETSVVKKPLDGRHACASRPDHMQRRTAAMRSIIDLGWPNTPGDEGTVALDSQTQD